jgi:hypothetical protein
MQKLNQEMDHDRGGVESSGEAELWIRGICNTGGDDMWDEEDTSVNTSSADSRKKGKAKGVAMDTRITQT